MINDNISLREAVHLHLALVHTELLVTEKGTYRGGICLAVKDLMDMSITDIHKLLVPYFKTWPEYSGNPIFPVPCDTTYLTVLVRGNLWNKRTKYGKLRWELLDFTQKAVLNDIALLDKTKATYLAMYTRCYKLFHKLVKPTYPWYTQEINWSIPSYLPSRNEEVLELVYPKPWPEVDYTTYDKTKLGKYWAKNTKLGKLQRHFLSKAIDHLHKKVTHDLADV